MDPYSLWYHIFSGFINPVTDTVTNIDGQLQMDYKLITVVTYIVSYYLPLPSFRREVSYSRKRVKSFQGVNVKRVDEYVLSLDERAYRIQCSLVFTSISV